MRDGFRRGGVAHTQKGKAYPDDFFSDEQMAQMAAEPMIVVEHIEAEPKTHPGPGEGMDEDKAAAKGITLWPEFKKLIDAAKKAIEEGYVIGSGAPSIGAMEDIMGANVTTAQRDAAWEVVKKENNA